MSKRRIGFSQSAASPSALDAVVVAGHVPLVVRSLDAFPSPVHLMVDTRPRFGAELRTVAGGAGIPLVVVVDAPGEETRRKMLGDGADYVIPRKRLIDGAAEVIERHAWIGDDPSCQGGPPEAVQGALTLFNAGRFHDAHDELELEWRRETHQVRWLWQGILQVGIAFHHMARGNAHGATHMFTAGIPRLRRFWPVARTLDVAALLADAEHGFAALRDALMTRPGKSGSDVLAGFDPGVTPTVKSAAERPNAPSAGT